MFDENFDPKKIRKCELTTVNDEQMIQFIATGDRHKMMKQDDGSISMIKLPEQGKNYKYHKPFPAENALLVLEEGHFPSHKEIAKQIRAHLAQQSS